MVQLWILLGLVAVEDSKAQHVLLDVFQLFLDMAQESSKEVFQPHSVFFLFRHFHSCDCDGFSERKKEKEKQRVLAGDFNHEAFIVNSTTIIQRTSLL